MPGLAARPRPPGTPKPRPARTQTPHAWPAWAVELKSDANEGELGGWFFRRPRSHNRRQLKAGPPRILDRDPVPAQPWVESPDPAERSSCDAARDEWHPRRPTAKCPAH